MIKTILVVAATLWVSTTVLGFSICLFKGMTISEIFEKLKVGA